MAPLVDEAGILRFFAIPGIVKHSNRRYTHCDTCKTKTNQARRFDALRRPRWLCLVCHQLVA